MAKSKDEDAKSKAKINTPRSCHQNERAEGDLKRFKLRAQNAGSRGYRYVLAPDRATAEAFYLEAEGLAIQPEGADPVQVSVVDLPD
ncbi:unnamed protein product [Gemmata massiliana]|uniref:Uncharacterized protein n=1 Tax=Gemmata massiliana TaxID=1210884 RepID=A0A6P2CWE0_9BACT|nr:hypothetical protein [Gemmata massiliana]VTR93213.1 unnamed protein product [Gemmata massiliana]